MDGGLRTRTELAVWGAVSLNGTGTIEVLGLLGRHVSSSYCLWAHVTVQLTARLLSSSACESLYVNHHWDVQQVGGGSGTSRSPGYLFSSIRCLSVASQCYSYALQSARMGSPCHHNVPSSQIQTTYWPLYKQQGPAS